MVHLVGSEVFHQVFTWFGQQSRVVHELVQKRKAKERPIMRASHPHLSVDPLHLIAHLAPLTNCFSFSSPLEPNSCFFLDSFHAFTTELRELACLKCRETSLPELHFHDSIYAGGQFLGESVAQMSLEVQD